MFYVLYSFVTYLLTLPRIYRQGLEPSDIQLQAGLGANGNQVTCLTVL
jgi:hypothetical protein